MLTQGLSIDQEAIEVQAAFKPSWAYTVNAGTYLKTGASPGQEFFFPKAGDGGGSVEKAAIADPWKSVMVDDSRGLCVVTVFTAAVCEKGAQFFKNQLRL